MTKSEAHEETGAESCLHHAKKSLYSGKPVLRHKSASCLVVCEQSARSRYRLLLCWPASTIRARMDEYLRTSVRYCVWHKSLKTGCDSGTRNWCVLLREMLTQARQLIFSCDTLMWLHSQLYGESHQEGGCLKHHQAALERSSPIAQELQDRLTFRC